MAGDLSTDLDNLKMELQDQFMVLSQRHRRRLDPDSVIHLVFLENECKQEVDITLTFPRVEFNADEPDRQTMIKPISASDLIKIVKENQSESLFDETYRYFMNQIGNPEPTIDPQLTLNDRHLTTVKVIFNAQEYLILQKQWLIFDLYSGNQEWLSTYECSQEETFSLIKYAVAKNPRSTSLNDLITVFGEQCKFSHSERLKKWAIQLDKDFCQRASADQNLPDQVRTEVISKLSSESQ